MNVRLFFGLALSIEEEFKVVVYQDEGGKTFVAYDNFASLLAQYHNEEVSRTAQEVQHKLEALVTEAVGE